MRLLPILSLILVSAFWGIHAVVGKSVEAQLGPLPLTVLRFSFGALFYTPFLKRLFRLPRHTLWQLVLTGLLWAVLYPLFFYQSLRFISPLESLLVVNTAPLVVAILGWVLLDERLRVRQIIGIVIAFIGVCWTTVGQATANGSILGIALVVVAMFAFASYTVSSRSLTKKLPLLDMVAATSMIGAVELWIIVLFSGKTSEIIDAVSQLTGTGWLELLYVVLFVSTIAYVLYGYGLKNVTSAVSSALTFYPQILFAAVVQWLWLGIAPSTVVILSAVLILGGVLLMQFPSRKRKTAS